MKKYMNGIQYTGQINSGFLNGERYIKIQNGPIKENGVNGCQVDTIIEATKAIIEGLNKKDGANTISR